MVINEEHLTHYSRLFKKLRRDHRFGGAPHKPILLLSIIRLYERGLIESNRIYLTAELITTFRQLWQMLVHTPHKEQIALPYFHLRSEKFWKLICYPGRQFVLNKSKSIKSFKNLRENIHYAEIDPELADLFLDDSVRDFLYNEIIAYYFPHFGLRYTTPLNYTIEEEYVSMLLQEREATYRTKLEALTKKLSKDRLEEEVALRDSFFQRHVKLIYEHTCCVSKLKVSTSNQSHLVDACHIKPFGVFTDDRIPNGITLTPTLHRAFDDGLFTITEDYAVKTGRFGENKTSPYNLHQFDGMRIHLPADNRLLPSQESLDWHRRNVFNEK